jgi:choline dehydrogenase
VHDLRRRLFLKVSTLGSAAFATNALVGCAHRSIGRARSADVIIVGGGSAGCVLAARLSEDTRRQVLLLEAGPDYRDEHSIPAELRNTFPVNTKTFCQFWPGDLGRLSRPPLLGTARVIGGGSAVNMTGALRGHPSDYDEWASRGNGGWAFLDVLPFFRKLEHDYDFSGVLHGNGGPISILRCRAEEWLPSQKLFVSTAEALGHSRVADHNSNGPTGIGAFPINTVGGIRQSTVLRYLLPARARPNLIVRGNTLVDRVVWEGRRAVGVRLSNGNVIAGGQVVLCAGTYGSPAILMRSGIGPAPLLRKLGIRILDDERPGVGKNLIDHPCFFVNFVLRAGFGASEKPLPVIQTLLTLCSSNRESRYDVLITPLFTPQLVFPSGSERGPVGARFLISLFRPMSIGTLRLISAAPTELPQVDCGFYKESYDLDRITEGLTTARQILRTPPFRDCVLEEDPATRNLRTREELHSYILSSTGTNYHPVGTCRMGLAKDPYAVVDSAARVHGIEGLHIVDASIMPTIPAATTNIPTIMIAERCAGLI